MLNQWCSPPPVLSILVSTAALLGALFATDRFVATGKIITKVAEATSKDVDVAVAAAHKAFETTWGLNMGGAGRSRLLAKLAQLMEDHQQELAALEALDNGTFHVKFDFG